MPKDVLLVHTIAEVRQAVATARAAKKRIGFVPTMGALHAGHESLIRQAVSDCDFVVVSVFVNPLQFGPSEDLDRYPRTLEADVALIREIGADVVFAPSVNEMYPQEQLTFVSVEKLADGLCGASRPGHFQGVTTVVTKLFNIVSPDVAYFGQKDAQQAAIIVRMVEDLCMPIKIIVSPTMREADGLAMSSRNQYLDSDERKAATVLIRALKKAEAAIKSGERKAATIEQMMQAEVAAEKLARLDYAVVVDAGTLAPVSYIKGRVLLALAVYIGKTRLIDNLSLEIEG